MVDSTSTVSVSAVADSTETQALRAKRKAQKDEAKASVKRASKSDKALGLADNASKPKAVNESPEDAGQLVEFFGLPYAELIDAVKTGIDAKSATAQLSRARRLACSALWTLSTTPNLDTSHVKSLERLCESARARFSAFRKALPLPKGALLPATDETALTILRFVFRCADSTRATIEATRLKKAAEAAEAARALADAQASASASLELAKAACAALRLSKAQRAVLASLSDSTWQHLATALRASING